MASTEREQVAVPKSNNSGSGNVGPTLTTSVNYSAGAGSDSLYRITDRKTPAMADGSLHGKIENLTHRGTNFDGSINT